MATQSFANFVYNNLGVAVNGATIDIFLRNTTTPVATVPATITSDANGYWTATVATEDRCDVRVTSGTAVRWFKYDVQVQLTRAEFLNLRIRGADNLFDASIVSANQGADVTLTLPNFAGVADTPVFATLAQTLSNKTFVAPALGTPASGVLANCTGLPAASVLPGSLGAGAFVVSTSLQAATVELGHATDTTLTRVSAGLIAVEGVTVVDVSTAQTLTNKRATAMVVSAVSITTSVAINADITDMHLVTAQAGAILYSNPTGTLTEGQKLIIRIKDNGTARAITWGAAFRAMGTALPTTTVLSKWKVLGFAYNVTDARWDLEAAADEA